MMPPWQQDLWAALAGSDPREMKIYMGGRQVGKSVMAQMWNIMFTECEIIDRATVDGAQMYTIQCNREIANWIRQQPGNNSQWYEHIDHNWVVDRTKYDVTEDFYLMLKLRFG
jgi:hypothetical protein